MDLADISKVLFLDVECVSGKANYDEISDDFKSLWKLKSKFILKKYGEEAAQKLIKTLEDTHDIKVGETKKIETSAQIPLAVGASQEAASG